MPVIRLLALSSLSLLLAACQKPAPSDAAATAASAAPAATTEAPPVAAPAVGEATPKPPELGDFRIVSVALGKALAEDGGVAGDSNVFAAQDTLYAAVLSTGTHQGLSLSAKWSTAEGIPIAVTRQALVPQAPTATVFKLSNPAGWPAGKYQVVIAVDDYPLQTRAFEVR